jgi:hypothetical protein
MVPKTSENWSLPPVFLVLFLFKKRKKSSDVSKKYNGINEPIDWIIYKLYKDFQWTFDIDNNELNFLDDTEINIRKIKWLINQSLRRINNDLFYNSIDDCYSYLKNDAYVRVSDVLRIYTENGYLEEYQINE